MTPDELRNVVERKDIYDPAREDGLRTMLSTFYSRQMRSTALLVWVNFIVWGALAAASVFRLFSAQDIRYQLLYAVLFVTFVQWATLTKVFAWQMIHRNSIRRDLKRLELRLAEMEACLRPSA